MALSGDALASSVLGGSWMHVWFLSDGALAGGLCSHEKWAGTPMGHFRKDSAALHLNGYQVESR